MRFRLLILFISFSAIVFGKEISDQLKVETFQLKNGLTVYLNQDHTMPTVQGMVVVKGGAKRDPKDATGIAHYFEHIMFKGTDKIGTVNYEEEQKLLEQIKVKYDELAKAADEEKRASIQKEINELSVKAADYAIPNEFDRIVNGMGGAGLNAGTSSEYIVYYNSFPANQIEKWMELYSHRFINPVFRLFQSELETVYEEKNMYADNPMTKMFEDFQKEFYKKYPYGQQTTLGTAEHLKNPSLSKMQEYFDNFYVANNMALILTGNFEKEEVKALIESKFGVWRNGDVPNMPKYEEQPFKGRESASKRLTPVKIGLLGFRTIPQGHKDQLALEVIEKLLSNSSGTGLLNELKNENEIMFAETMADLHQEIGGHYIIVVPKIVGQSLKSAEKKVIGQLDKLKNGEFSDELLEAVKINMIKNHERSLEDMRWRSYAIMETFIYGEQWSDVINYSDALKNISREQVLEIAKKYFGDNYLAFHSKMGFPKKDKVDKPAFEPVKPKNSEAKSEYAKMIEEMPVKEMEPQFIEFEKDVQYTDLRENVHLYVNPNPINDVFTIRLKYAVGTYSFPRLTQSAQFIQYCGIGEGTYKEFYKELQKLGASMSAYAGIDNFTISINGLEENIEPTIELVSKFFKNPSSNSKHIKKIYQEVKTEEKFLQKDPSTVARALKEYALYDTKSTYLNRLSVKEVKKLKSYELITDFKRALQYETSIHYSGKLPLEKVSSLLNDKLYFPATVQASKTPIERTRKKVAENTIYFINDSKAIQSQIHLMIEGEVNNEEDRTINAAFNEYFGSGMSSLVFQEIREFRSLAYGAYGSYRPSFFKENQGYFNAFLSTQADKTVEALETLTGLIKEMPEKPERLDVIKNSITQSINANRPSFRYLSSSVESWRKQGYANDPRKERIEVYENLNFDQIKQFYAKNLQGKPWVIVIVGDEKRMNIEELTNFGKFIEIKKDEVFK